MNAPLIRPDLPGDAIDAPLPTAPTRPGLLHQLWTAMRRWVDNHSAMDQIDPHAPPSVDWIRILPFIGLHVACLLVFWVGASWVAVAVALLLYAVRMFAITGFYHRYFSHRTFSTSRVSQFIFACLGNASAQRGPLWWAAHHRHHHRYSDAPLDRHSPVQSGFLWSHMGWFSAQANFRTNLHLVPDLARFPELRLLDRFDIVVPLLLAAACYTLGSLLHHVAPGLHTSGLQMWVWGFCISTVAVAHATFTVNSLAHLIGHQTYPSNDASRNNFLIAIITFGEGWHNNHHHYPSSVRQGHRWWQIDLTFYALWLMSSCGLIWNLKGIPQRIRAGQAG